MNDNTSSTDSTEVKKLENDIALSIKKEREGRRPYRGKCDATYFDLLSFKIKKHGTYEEFLYAVKNIHAQFMPEDHFWQNVGGFVTTSLIKVKGSDMYAQFRTIVKELLMEEESAIVDIDRVYLLDLYIVVYGSVDVEFVQKQKKFLREYDALYINYLAKADGANKDLLYKEITQYEDDGSSYDIATPLHLGISTSNGPLKRFFTIEEMKDMLSPWMKDEKIYSKETISLFFE